MADKRSLKLLIALLDGVVERAFQPFSGVPGACGDKDARNHNDAYGDVD